MTIDDAIQYAENLGTEEENKIDYDKDSPHMIICRKNTVKDYRQLAEWLTELKELRNSLGAVKLKDMKEAVGLLQELNTENDQLTSQLAEAKRLLKLAVEDINSYVDCYESHCDECCCSQDNHCHWKHEAEALALIGEDSDDDETL